MKTKMIPCCFYPTTVCLVDDNQEFAELISFAIERLSPCIFYTNPRLAVQELNQLPSPALLKQVVTVDEDTDPDNRKINIKLDRLHQLLYQESRLKEVSVLIVDYQMPGMTGIELCQQITVPGIKKILLTGEADAEIAIQAFNQGIIDKFLKKDASRDINDDIYQAVLELQKELFVQQTQVLMQFLTPDEIGKLHLKNTSLANWFNQYLKNYQIIEYYLVDGSANYLMINKNGEFHWLLLRDDADMQRCIHYAHDICNNENDPNTQLVLDKLNSKSFIPFFYCDDDYQAKVEDWDKYLQLANKVELENKTFYYAKVDYRNPYRLLDKSIKLFEPIF